VKGSGIGFYAPVVVSGSTISDNSATNGTGGIYAKNGLKVTISSSTVQGNQGLEDGGVQTLGTGMNSVSLTIANSTFTGNIGTDKAAAIFSDSNNAVSITGSKILDNFSASAGGGANISFASKTTVANTIISGNVSHTFGGGLILYRTGFDLIGSSITGNSAGTMGGGIYIGAGLGKIIGTTISDNSALGKGGGIDSVPASMFDIILVESAKITGNTALMGPNVYGNYFRST
jgi:hypothetical protein